MPDTLTGQVRDNERLFDECKRLVHILARKNECVDLRKEIDPDIAVHIASMGSTLAMLCDLINRVDSPSTNMIESDFVMDGQGFMYHSVRSCDLDRISDK